MFYKIKMVTILFLFTTLLGSAYAGIDSLSEEELYSKLQAEFPVIADHSSSVITLEQKDSNYIHIYNLKTRIVDLHPEWSDSAKEAILNSNVEIRMTKEQVQASLGLPKDISINIDKYSINEQWYYGGSYYLYFEDGELSGWQSK